MESSETLDGRIRVLEDSVRKLQRALAVALVAIGVVVALFASMRFGVVKTRGIAVVDGAGRTVIAIGAAGDATGMRLLGADGSEKVALTTGPKDSSLRIAPRSPASAATAGIELACSEREARVRVAHTGEGSTTITSAEDQSLRVYSGKAWSALQAGGASASVEAVSAGDNIVSTKLWSFPKGADISLFGFDSSAQFGLNPITGPGLTLSQSPATASLTLYKGQTASLTMRALKGAVALGTGFQAPVLELTNPADAVMWTTKK